MKELKIADVEGNLIDGKEFLVTQDNCSNWETLETEAAAENYDLPDVYKFDPDDQKAIEIMTKLGIDRTPAYVNFHGKAQYPESLLELKDLH